MADATHCGLQPHPEPVVKAASDGPEFNLCMRNHHPAIPILKAARMAAWNVWSSLTEQDLVAVVWQTKT